MSDVNEAGLKALDALCDEPGTLALGDRLKNLRDVLKGLSGVGIKNVWVWVPIILQLFQTLGPMIEKIIDIITDAIKKGQTPDTFTTA